PRQNRQPVFGVLVRDERRRPRAVLRALPEERVQPVRDDAGRSRSADHRKRRADVQPLFRRDDGTILTADCPVGLRAVRRRVAKLAGGLAGAFVFLIGATGLLGVDPAEGMNSLRHRQPFASIRRWLLPLPPLSAPTVTRVLTGDMMIMPILNSGANDS